MESPDGRKKSDGGARTSDSRLRALPAGVCRGVSGASQQSGSVAGRAIRGAPMGGHFGGRSGERGRVALDTCNERGTAGAVPLWRAQAPLALDTAETPSFR